MFFDNKKIPLVREMIIAQTYEQRMSAIEKLKPLQVADFYVPVVVVVVVVVASLQLQLQLQLQAQEIFI